jgi:hypothetical protein
LVLSYIVPEYFIDFQAVWIDGRFMDFKYEDMVFLREDIELWDNKLKIKMLIKIIDKIGYKVFEEEVNNEATDSDSEVDTDSDDEKNKHAGYLKLLENNSIFYFPLLHKLYKSKYN